MWQGSISERQITKDSKILEKILLGDVILADCGFTIHDDLCAEKGATLEIPPFLNGCKEFTEPQVTKTELIAHFRIHMERFNERIKKY